MKPNRYLYWIPEEAFDDIQSELESGGTRFRSAILTPCQVMHAEGSTVYYARPELWSRMCVRQGSWYRDSERLGQVMMMSENRLPAPAQQYLDAVLSSTDFQPESLPSQEELVQLVTAQEYTEAKPSAWERISFKDAWMFKVFFGLTRFWKRGDNLAKHWLGQRANHANFLARHFTTEIEGEQVAYSVTENESVCSSCVEFFNVAATDTRKLVRACPGSVIFGGAERDVYLDVVPQAQAGQA